MHFSNRQRNFKIQKASSNDAIATALTCFQLKYPSLNARKTWKPPKHVSKRRRGRPGDSETHMEGFETTFLDTSSVTQFLVLDETKAVDILRREGKRGVVGVYILLKDRSKAAYCPIPSIFYHPKAHVHVLLDLRNLKIPQSHASIVILFPLKTHNSRRERHQRK